MKPLRIPKQSPRSLNATASRLISEAMNNTEPDPLDSHPECDDHARQNKVRDPFTGRTSWVCLDCGEDCGNAPWSFDTTSSLKTADTTLSSNGFSTDQQALDALEYLRASFMSEYQTIKAMMPEVDRMIFDGSWLDTETMGVDPEWGSWLIDAIEATGLVWWEEGEPWAEAPDGAMNYGASKKTAEWDMTIWPWAEAILGGHDDFLNWKFGLINAYLASNRDMYQDQGFGSSDGNHLLMNPLLKARDQGIDDSLSLTRFMEDQLNIQVVGAKRKTASRPGEQIYLREGPVAAGLLADGESSYGWGYEMGRADISAGLDRWDTIPVGYEEGYADGYVDFSPHSAHRRTAAVPSVDWGKPYGSPENGHYMTPDGPVWMFRKGQKVRFYSAQGEQVGAEQANVATAVAYALSQPDWSDRVGPGFYSASRNTAALIPPDMVEQIRAAISTLDTEDVRQSYRSGDFPRSESVKDLDRRYRWDLFNSAVDRGLLPGGFSFVNSIYDDLGGNDSHIDTALRNIVPRLASRKKAMPAPADLGVKVGDFFFTNWGYGQTNVDFFEVVALTPLSVKVKGVGSLIVDRAGGPSESVVPDPSSPPLSSRDGDIITRRLMGGGNPSIKIDDVRRAWLWDGSPQHQTGYGYGH